jgi:hypothetical protein
VAFIGMMAGPGVGFADPVICRRALRYKAGGMGDDEIALQKSWHKKLYTVTGQDMESLADAETTRELFDGLSDDEKKRLNWKAERSEKEIPGLLNPWWRCAMAYDPAKTLKKVKCPVLAVIGEKDMQGPAGENITAFEKALQAGGNKRTLIKVLPGLNPVFQTAQTGSEGEYTKIEETRSPNATACIADLILEQGKRINETDSTQSDGPGFPCQGGGHPPPEGPRPSGGGRGEAMRTWSGRRSQGWKTQKRRGENGKCVMRSPRSPKIDGRILRNSLKAKAARTIVGVQSGGLSKKKAETRTRWKRKPP